MIEGLEHLLYKERPKELALLEERRLWANLINAYK